MKFNRERYDWVFDQAFHLSTRKDKDSVGAMAWALTVALGRFLEQPSPIGPSAEELAVLQRNAEPPGQIPGRHNPHLGARNG